MKVSIITTIYKAEQDLPRLLDSMMALKSPELEFFLIDNGSPDCCGEICKEYASRDTRFTIHTLKENIGYIGARNFGLSLVDGDFVGFCDSDDYLEPDGYDRAIDILKKYDCDLYLASWKTISENGIKVNDVPYAVGLYTKEQIKESILPNAFGPINGKGGLHGFAWKQIFRRKIASKFKFIEELKPYEDQIFNLDVIKNCDIIYVDNTPLYNYIVNTESITAKLAANFDVDAEWERLKFLNNEKKLRSEGDILDEAVANDFLLNIYEMLLNELKFRNTFIVAGSLIVADKQLVSEVCCRSSHNQSIVLKLVRFCLKHNCLGILSIILKGGYSLRNFITGMMVKFKKNS